MAERKPIPKHRSPAEAIWAVFFHRIGWAAEGDDGEAWYLPEPGVYATVAAAGPDGAAAERCARLAGRTARPVWLIAGLPGRGTYGIRVFGDPKAPSHLRHCLGTCPRCDRALLLCRPEEDASRFTIAGRRVLGAPCDEPECGDRPPILGGRLAEALRADRDRRARR